MGRNKIKIEKIDSERKRTATYTKRSHGLIKKAMELSILCECEVSLFIFANDKLVVYSSKDVKDTLIKFVEFKSNYFSYSNQDVCFFLFIIFIEIINKLINWILFYKIKIMIVSVESRRIIRRILINLLIENYF